MFRSARRRHRPQTTTRRLLAVEQLEDRLVPTLLGQSLFPADNPWNQQITGAPVAADSAAIMNAITGTYGDGHIHPDFGQDARSSNPLYGIPFNVVHGNSTPRVHVVIDAYPGESDLQDAPIPPSAVLEGDLQNGPNPALSNRGDSHLIVWDQDKNVAYEFYHASRPGENSDGSWHADQESVWDMKTDSFRTIGWTSADAAGLAILPGLVRPDEGLPVSQGGQGVITHAIRFTLKNAAVLGQFLYPASHEANSGTSAATQPPMGARFRLKAGVDISGLNPESKIIAQAMKDYGLILADNGSNFFFSGASYSVDANNQFALTWNDGDIQDTVHGLKSLTFSDFEVVDLRPVVSGLSTSSGPAGTQVTVTGQNFSGAAGRLQVLFGGTPSGSVQVVDDSHVVAVAPAGSGTVDVRVQSGVSDPNDPSDYTSPVFGYGVSATSAADRFTYSSGPGAATHLLIGAPAGSTAGAAFGVTVTALDGNNATAAGYGGTVHFTGSDPQAVLPADYTFTAADAGVHTFSLNLKTAGPRMLTATDGTRQASATVNVAPASAARLAVTTQPPGTVTAGSAFGLAVSAQDAYGNLATPFTGGVAVALASNPGGATLGGTLIVNAVGGVASFSGLTLDRAGSGYTLQATSSGLASATTNPFNVASIALSGSSVYEFRPVGTAVGTFATAGTGSGHTFMYTLVPGAGSADNGSFTISANQLLTADAFDFAARSSYSVRVRSTDEANNALEQALTITVLDDPSLTRSGRTLTVSGTAGNDTFSFAADPVRHGLSLNGVSLAVDTATVDTVVFQGGGGSDSATLAGRPGGGNTLALAPGTGSLAGPGYTLRPSGVATITASGGPGDSATLTDSPGDDAFVATPTSAYLHGSGFFEQASGFGSVTAVSGAGGHDAASLYDSAGNDTLVATPSDAYLYGQGFFNQAAGFPTVLGFSSAGGSDTAELYDAGPGGSALVAGPTYAYLTGGRSFLEALSFGTVIGVAAANDAATLYDSPGADNFVGLPGLAYLLGTGFFNQAHGFPTVSAVSSAGGSDRATLYGSAAGGDTLVATPSVSYLRGGGSFNQATGFAAVVAISQGPNDSAYLYGSAGSDVLLATASYAYLQGANYFLQASGFRGVTAYGMGGSDQAYLYGTLTSADTFVQSGSWAYLYGNAFLDQVNAFASLYPNPNARR